MNKPLIGLTTSLSERQNNNHLISIGANYTNSVRLAGGIPLPLPAPCIEYDMEVIREAVEEYLSVIDGLLVIGGPDIDPATYNEEKLPTCGFQSKHRVDFEQCLVKECYKRKFPLLGICLGHQVLNVAAGGSLYQDIPYNFPDWTIKHGKQLVPYFTMHNVKVEKDSMLYKIVGTENLETNSSHHQSVKEPGDGFRIVGKAEDGIVESIEKTDGSFALGVQWHPEYLARSDEKHLALFKALVNAAIENKKKI